ncbi:conserved hypothetical protein [Candidatus Desulfosporosinus infrequens]|uniref:Uncharacterized protein n=1 Tax=Candidatus Desulfosporosinus infrequens TaxID=2043169 RepID=A0A2U3JWS9_9FIRM|nr:conserved hypothetical protein [Candidatus Desulfosporosinus infrequens]
MNRGFEKPRANEESANNLEAGYQLGMDIISGRAEDKDLPEAVSLFHEAALQGHPGAQYELGVSYCRGRGIKQSSENALQWFTRSAENGYPKALHNLGVRHSIGKGVDQDAVRAARLFLQAASQGHTLSQFKLAVMYKLGWGVQQKDEEAEKWFSLAGGTGKNEAMFPLSEIAKQENDRARWLKEAMKLGYTGNEFKNCEEFNLLNLNPGAILRETHEHIQSILGEEISKITLERVVIGLFFTGVKLSNGLGGICFTPIKTIPEAVCCPSSARAMPNSGRLKGTPVLELLQELYKSNSLRKAISIAVLNALSETCWQKSPPQGYEVQSGIDALEVVEIPEEAYVVVVGALAPFLKKLIKRGKPFTILEMDPSTLKPNEMPFYVHGSRAAEIVPKADVLVITGTTLINDTLDDLLQLAKPEAHIVVVGPTASLLPDAFFKRGVDVLGGISVTKPDELLDLLAEAGSGYHFFGKSANRTVIRKCGLKESLA